MRILLTLCGNLDASLQRPTRIFGSLTSAHIVSTALCGLMTDNMLVTILINSSGNWRILVIGSWEWALPNIIKPCVLNWGSTMYRNKILVQYLSGRCVTGIVHMINMT